MPNTVKSSCYLFADDTKMYSQIRNMDDSDTLQQDINNLQEWSNKWQLKFHPDKCNIMTIGKNRDTPQRKYEMQHEGVTHQLKHVLETKDLGITIDTQLSFQNHIQDKVNKANRVMGMIRRSFSHLNKEIFKQLYKSQVRPHLEYAQAAWSPYRKKDITAIENVQRRATKLIPGLKHLSYPERLKELNLPTLIYRRHRGDMIEMYKILNFTYDKEVCPSTTLNQSTTRGNQQKLYKERSKTLTRKHYFTNRINSPWNSLPDQVILAKSVKSFESHLDKFWSTQEVKFDPQSELRIAFSKANPKPPDKPEISDLDI